MYRINDWDKHYENSRSRQVKATHWVPIPNAFDGHMITDLIEQGGDKCYAAFVATILVASRCNPRGTLILSSGKPHTSRSLHRITGISEKAFDQMFQLSVDIGLMSDLSPDHQGDATAMILDWCQGGNRMEGMERKERREDTGASTQSVQPPPTPLFDFPIRGGKTWTLTKEFLDDLSETYKGVDLNHESRKALAWCNANPSRRKTARGMPSFLVNWFSNAEPTNNGDADRKSLIESWLQ